MQLQIFNQTNLRQIDLSTFRFINSITLPFDLQIEIKMQNKNIQKIQRELEASEKRYSTILQAVPDVIYKMDKDGYFTFLNSSVSDLGYKPEELIEKHFREIVHPEDVELFSRSVVLPKYANRVTYIEKSPKLFDERRTGTRITRDLEIRLMQKNQEVVKSDISGTASSIIVYYKVTATGDYDIDVNTKDKKFSGTVGVIRRYTKCKKMEEELIRYRKVVEQNPVSIMITDTEGNLEYVNPKFTKLTGYNSEEVIGKNPSILKTGKTTPEEYERLWKTITSGNEWRGEFQNRKKDGELYWEDAFIAPVRNDKGDIINFIAIKEDITEQKKKDKQLFIQSRQAQMGEMLSIIAHQWKQPLTIINAISSNIMNRLILDKIDKDDVLKSLEKVQNQIKYLSHTIDDFRGFFKPDMAKGPVNIESIIRKCLDLVRYSMKKNRIKVDVSLESVKEIETYYNELIQVFLNILQNVGDIINHRKVENALVVIRMYEKDGFVVVDITDNAGGISEEIIEDIFLPYFSTKDKKQGTGLGLYICKIIIEEHCKGKIVAENVEGGVNFKVKLPIT